eukprot:g11762.t2
MAPTGGGSTGRVDERMTFLLGKKATAASVETLLIKKLLFIHRHGTASLAMQRRKQYEEQLAALWTLASAGKGPSSFPSVHRQSSMSATAKQEYDQNVKLRREAERAIQLQEDRMKRTKARDGGEPTYAMVTRQGEEIFVVKVARAVAVHGLSRVRKLLEGQEAAQSGPPPVSSRADAPGRGLSLLGVRGIVRKGSAKKRDKEPKAKRPKPLPKASQGTTPGDAGTPSVESSIEGVQRADDTAAVETAGNGANIAEPPAAVDVLAAEEQPQATGPAGCIYTDVDIWSIVNELLGENQYLRVALVSKFWRNSWRKKRHDKHSKYWIGSWGNEDYNTHGSMFRGMSGALLASFFDDPTNSLRPSHVVSTEIAGWGDVELMKVAIAYKCGSMDVTPCATAAEKGHLACLQLMVEAGYHWKVEVLESAAFGGHLHVLDWALKNKCPIKNEAVGLHAVRGGNQLVIDWARAKGFRMHIWAFAEAAKLGNLAIMEDLYATGCPFSASSCMGAAEHGHLHALKWLRERGCPWDQFVCSCAAGRGHLDILQYARENGCPWTSAVIVNASSNKHDKVIAWARANGCEEPPP